MDHEALAHAAAVVGAFGACGLLLARGRLLFLGGLAALVAAEAGLAYALVPDAPSLLTASARPNRRARERPRSSGSPSPRPSFATRRGAGRALGGYAVPPLGRAGERDGVPAPPALRRPRRGRSGARLPRLAQGRLPAVPFLIAVPTSALVALAGLSLLWAKDPRAGTIALVFFYFPSRCCFRSSPSRDRGTGRWRALATGLVAVTSLFAAIGVYQAWSHTEILAKQDVQLANAYSAFFRVTSVFQDPSVYGRHLVLGIVVLLTALWLALVRPAVGLPVLGLLFIGLYFSYSQTSFVSLFCAVLVVTLIAGDRLTRRVVIRNHPPRWRLSRASSSWPRATATRRARSRATGCRSCR